MKKIFLICSLLVSVIGFGQSVVQRANAMNTVADNRWEALLNSFQPRYADTAHANLQKGIDSAGALIYTYDIKGFWYRQNSPKKWVRVVSDNNLSNNFFFDTTCNCYKIDTTSLMNIVNGFINDSTVSNISIVNDSTIRICYSNGSCVNIGIVTNITNISTVSFVTDSSIKVCAIDTTGGIPTTVCDTVTIGRQPITYTSGNWIRLITPNQFEYGSDQLVASPGLFLSHNTYANTGYYGMFWAGYKLYDAPYQFSQVQSFQNGSGVVSFKSVGNDLYNHTNNTRLIINYSADTLEKTPFIEGFFGRSIGYSIGTNWSGHGGYGVYLDDNNAKTTGVFFHQYDSTTTDGVTIYAVPDLGGTAPILNGQLKNYKVADFNTDKTVRFNGYNSSNNYVSDTGKYKVAVFDTTDGTFKKAHWVGGGALPALPLSHLYVGNSSNLPVDAGVNIIWDSLNSVLKLNGSTLTNAPIVVTKGSKTYPAWFYTDNSAGIIVSNATGTNVIELSPKNIFATSTGWGEYNFTTTNKLKINTQSEYVSIYPASTLMATFTSSGVGLKSVSSPTAILHLPAGTATANTAPLKFTTTAAALLATPEAGAMEVLVDSLYWTGNSGTRYKIYPQSSAITADNGLTASTSTNVQLGGTLLQNTSIATGAFTLTISTTTASQNPLTISSTSGNSINATASTSGTAINAQSSSGTGVNAFSTSGLPLVVGSNPSSTNSIVQMVKIQRQSSSTAANGIGGSIDFISQTTSGSATNISNQIESKWTDATDATRTSQFIITGVNSGTTQDLMSAAGNGAIVMYGTGAPGNTLEVVNSSNNSIYGHTTDGIGVTGASINSYGVQSATNPSSTNTVVGAFDIVRGTTGTAANGIGGSLDYTIQADNGTQYTSNQIISKWTTAANATRTSQMKLTGVLSASTVDLMTLNADGSWQIRPITATAASAITPAEGMMLFVSSTDATFTSIGFWGYQNGAWHAF